MEKLRIGVIGLGYWGPNLARNFNQSPNCELSYLCDANTSQLEKISALYPQAALVDNVDELLLKQDLDAVAIATPVSTHYALTKKALLSGKHVLVEKPMTDSVAEAQELVTIAKEQSLTLMVDHTFNYTSAIQKLKALIQKEELGELLYWDSVRINLGLLQQDVNVVWDLAPHDLSILDYLLDMKPISVKAVGTRHFSKKVEEVAYLTLRFENNFIAHFHFNWLSPVKVRQTLIGGSKKMVVYDDIEATEKIKIYDCGIDVIENDSARYERMVQYRTGDIYSPHLKNIEALGVEIEHFVNVVRGQETCISDGNSGLRVVRILEAAQKSIEANGQEVKL